MSICYDPFWETIEAKGLSKTEAREKIGITTGTFAKLSKNEKVSEISAGMLLKSIKC